MQSIRLVNESCFDKKPVIQSNLSPTIPDNWFHTVHVQIDGIKIMFKKEWSRNFMYVQYTKRVFKQKGYNFKMRW